ncbi:hypothetical protein [Mycolicibacterium hippocampi]|uniref:Uncharacterized protein n=1 Tax=Mycolicibacterium hippocampi TaxID=659824 RepID=A0A7I9ZQ48_9MYCO|nr:hypothetical protein [Mycolicibacterium hippocampi]GFH02798.1 hypothetical protein MHIP_32810 [Mycolicibacterium hippocampi]
MTTKTMQARLDALELELLPKDYFTAQEVAAQAHQRLSTLPGPPAADPALAPLATGMISDEWLDQVVAQKTATPLWEIRRGALLSVLKEANGRSEYLYNENRDHFLAALHEELQTFLGHAEKVVDDLGDCATAAEAIANDRTAQWKRLTELTNDYAVLREHQMRHVDPRTRFDCAPPDGGEDHASDLYLKNLDDIWPLWKTPGVETARFVHVNGTKPRFEPWPSDPTQQLRWLVTSAAEPWIPTSSELTQHLKDRQDRANPIAKVRSGRPDLPAPRQTFNGSFLGGR